MAPHLSALEAALARNGSRALQQLPIAVLRRSLEQMNLLHHADETREDAAHLRLLRLRVVEALCTRQADLPQPAAHGAPADPGQDPLRRGLEVRDISEAEFHQALAEPVPRHSPPPKTGQGS